MNSPLELTRWWSLNERRFTKPWLILGKGPSLLEYDTNQTTHHTIGLNHVLKLHRVTIAHAIDIEVIADCENIIDRQCDFLLMPYIPNVKFHSGGYPIEHFYPSLPILRQLAEQNRLVWYNLSNGSSDRRHPTISSPTVTAQYFSVEAVLDILGTLGVKRAFSYGIDGGTSYAPNVMQASAKTLLANGQQSFDLQFPRIHSILEKHKMSLTPLSTPCRVYVGTDDSQMVAAKVLEHSIIKHAKKPVQVIHMLNLDYPKVTNPNVRVGTGFSFARFKIPELAGYQGKAMYVDADMQVFSDITGLWERNMGNAKVACTRQDYVPEVWRNNPAFAPGRQMSVLMLDCEKLKWNIADIVEGLNLNQYTYKQLMTELCIVKNEEIDDTLSPTWNCLEHFEEGKTDLLHYTNVPTQPWKTSSNPLNAIWEGAFKDALKSGVLSLDLVTKSAMAGHIRADLLQMAIETTQTLPNKDDSEVEKIRNLLWQAIRDKQIAQTQLEHVEFELSNAKRKLEKYEGLFPIKMALKIKSLLKKTKR